MLPMLVSSAGTVESLGSQITIDELEVTLNMEEIFTQVGTVIGKFTSEVLTPVSNFVTTNPISLIFLGISFVGIGIRYMKRVTYAFGRGR